jgi:hypothetical protein
VAKVNVKVDESLKQFDSKGNALGMSFNTNAFNFTALDLHCFFLASVEKYQYHLLNPSSKNIGSILVNVGSILDQYHNTGPTLHQY